MELAGFMEVWYSIEEQYEADREFWPFSPDEDEEWEDVQRRRNRAARKNLSIRRSEH
jgi:hypothetical protein